MECVVTTLFEGDYHFGVVGLAHSLARNGFEGRIRAAFKGPVPPWCRAPADTTGAHRISLGAMELVLTPHTTDLHFTHFKPWWMQDVLAEERAAQAVFYFDPDIVVCSRWSYFPEWCGYGVALCEDNHYHVGPFHPLRHAWAEFAKDRGLEVQRPLNRFCNGGFVGVQRTHASSLSLWADLIVAAGPESGGLKNWRSLDRTHRFWSANQDTMNLAAMVTPHPVAIYGPNGMDFIPSAGRPIMSHAVDKPKPWRKQYLREALKGRPPSRQDRAFWDYAEGPLGAFPAGTARTRQRAIRIASFIARFYRRV